MAMSHALAPAAKRPSPAPATGGLTRRDFFDDVAARLRQELPEERRGFRHHRNPVLLKVHYGNERVHYEVAVNGTLGVLEIGLHFEDGPLSTAAYLAHFDGELVELKHALGPRVELERWTASWGHLYEIWPLPRLDAAAAKRVAARLAALIETLQPLVEAAGIEPERSALSPDAEPKGPWRAWRRG